MRPGATGHVPFRCRLSGPRVRNRVSSWLPRARPADHHRGDMDRSFDALAPVRKVRKWRPAGVFLSKGLATSGRLRSVARQDMIHRLPRATFVLACFGLLSGCVDNVVQAPDPSAPPATNIARRTGVSPAGRRWRWRAFSGAPQDAQRPFHGDFRRCCQTRRDQLSPIPEEANYLVRGYLSARPEGDATAVAFVLDIFDSKKERTQRVEDEVLIKGQAADPWSRCR